MTTFLEFKKALFKDYPDYDVFLQSVEASAIRMAKKILIPAYEPLLFELLLRDFGGLV
jgi:hypothetical protein